MLSSSLRATPRLFGRRMQPHIVSVVEKAAGWRFLSDSGGGDDGDKEQEHVNIIYNGLFGADDNLGDTMSTGNSSTEGRITAGASSSAGGYSHATNLGSSSSRSKTRQSQGSGTDEGPPPLEVSDIPCRLWSDSIDIPEERWHTKIEFDDIPDWSPNFVSRVSMERVQILPEGIPSLSSLSQLPLPPPPPPHPGHGKTKEYADFRRRAHFEYISKEVVKIAEPKVSAILSLPTWQEKQDAVDELFESVEFKLRESETVLCGHPQFGYWVERALESYLKGIKREADMLESSDQPVAESAESSKGEEDSSTVETDGNPASYPGPEEDAQAVPIFMNCFSSTDSEDQMVPQILAPLRPHHREGPGRMVEEWELSAHTTAKRILLRQSTREIARALLQSPSARVFVSGRKGVGKSAAVASIVASARKSGYIVLYLPDGNRLHRLGYYVQPNPKLDGMFDLPMLSQEVCKEFLSSHEGDLEGMEASKEVMEHFFTDLQLEELSEYSGGSIPLVDLLKAAETNLSAAPMCYSVAVHCLVNQEEKPFLMALDEFNCYFEPGHYFHMEYDDDVVNAIPYDQINLFKPALDAMALSTEEDEDIPLLSPVAPKRGGIVVGISESCAIARKVTDSLAAYAYRSASTGNHDVPLVVCEVPRFSELEVDHILANFEAIGIGNLRCDRGKTVLNTEGVAYLRMVSSSVGQNLLDVCCG